MYGEKWKLRGNWQHERTYETKISLVLYDEVKSNFKTKLHIEVCTHEAIGGTEYWKMDTRSLKGVRVNNELVTSYV
jgi:hypothetical protein